MTREGFWFSFSLARFRFLEKKKKKKKRGSTLSFNNVLGQWLVLTKFTK